MKKQLLGVAGAVALALGAGSASAFTVGSTSLAGGNQGLDEIYAGATSANGFFGANWYLVGGEADIKVTYLGTEAGWVNRFTFMGTSIDTVANTSGNNFNPAGFGPSNTFTKLGVLSGLLGFSFSTFGGTAAITDTVNNGTNPDIKDADLGINFFSRIADAGCGPTDPVCYGGKILHLWLDDQGANVDDNHDDMVIQIEIVKGGSFVVPIPAALPLLLSGLAGLGFIGRRRRVVAA